MKIHILTQPLGHNYGGNLQAYALQKVLMKMGHEVVTLDRQWNSSPLTIKLLLMRLASVCKSFFFKALGQPRYICNPFSKQYNALEDKRSLHRNVRENLNMSRPLYSSKETEEYIKSQPADVYIVGSDQVWRRAYCPSVADYYLSSVPDEVTKISYAASFGKDDISEYSDAEVILASKLIHRFKAISVREDSGIDICREKFDIAADKVLDPTLLLTADDYMDLMLHSSIKKGGGYLGVYILDDSEEKQRIIKEATSVLDLPTSIINVDQSMPHYFKYPSVEEWIANIALSDFVITDSFHGMVFSILFEKQFMVINNSKRGGARFESLLSELGINSRILNDSFFIPNNEIDYTIVKKRLELLRLESLEWLESQIVEA